jgi:hypothetical protein
MRVWFLTFSSDSVRMSSYPYYRTEASTRKGLFTYSISQKRDSFKDYRPLSPEPYDIHDLTDSDQELTFQYTSPTFTTNSSSESEQTPKSTLTKLEESKKDFIDPIDHIKNVTDIKVNCDGTNEVKRDSKLVGYSILFSVCLFLLFQVFPIMKNFSKYLNSRIGSIGQLIVVGGLSIGGGCRFASSRWYYGEKWIEIQKHRSYPSLKAFSSVIVGLYISTYTTDWIFSLLFRFCMGVPILGPLFVAVSLFWGAVCFGMISLLTFGKFSWKFVKSVCQH